MNSMKNTWITLNIPPVFERASATVYTVLYGVFTFSSSMMLIVMIFVFELIGKD